MHALVAEPSKLVILTFTSLVLVLLDRFFEYFGKLIIEIGMMLQQAVGCRVLGDCVVCIFDHFTGKDLIDLASVDFFDREHGLENLLNVLIGKFFVDLKPP